MTAEEKHELLRSAVNVHCSAQDLLTKAVKTVIVSEAAIEIRSVRTIAESDQVRELDGDSDAVVTLEIPGKLQRSPKGECFVLTPDHASNLPRQIPSLMQAVARANDWVARIVSGQSANSRAVARETGLDERYVSRILPLAFLAPYLTEAILEGVQADGFVLADYSGNPLLEWADQRRAFERPTLSHERHPVEAAAGCQRHSGTGDLAKAYPELDP